MKTDNRYMDLCIEEVRKTKETGADLESILNFLVGWFKAEVKFDKEIKYSSESILKMVEAVLEKGGEEN